MKPTNPLAGRPPSPSPREDGIDKIARQRQELDSFDAAPQSELLKKLRRAAREGDSISTSHLLSKMSPEEVNAAWTEDSKNKTPLMNAIQKGNLEVAQKILGKLGPDDLFVKDAQNRTPLMHAALQGNVELADQIFQKMEQSKQHPNVGKLALEMLLQAGNGDVAKTLMWRNPDILDEVFKLAEAKNSAILTNPLVEKLIKSIKKS